MPRFVLMHLLCLPLLAAADNPAVTTLQAGLANQIAAAEAEDKVKALVRDSLLPLTRDATWVADVIAQNAKKTSLDAIKKIDAQWQEAEDELPIQKELLSNTTANVCKQIAAKIPAIKEIFVMDNQGANVGQSALTSDYWQGDEPKWSNSFNGGKGGIDVGKVKFDKSSNVSMQQVSLPIIAEDGSVIGAVTFGIDVSAL